jgi:hypothetical protein
MQWSQPVLWSPRNTRRGGIGTQSSHSTAQPASCCAPSHFSPSFRIPTCLALPLLSTGLRIHKELTWIPPFSVTLICKEEHQSLETTLSLSTTISKQETLPQTHSLQNWNQDGNRWEELNSPTKRPKTRTRCN